MTASLVIVDDEPLARSGLRKLVERHGAFHVAGECGDGRGALETIARLAPEAVLLDVQMPAMDGFAVLRALAAAGKPLPVIVFITAHDEFAVEAFRVHALDYVVKPFSDARFAAALDRAAAALRAAEEGELGRRLLRLAADLPRAPSTPRLAVRTGERVLLIDQNAELEWVEADSYYAKLHVRGATHLLRESLTSLEARLDPARFVRVHRSAIVNLAFVREIRSADLVLTTGARVPVAKDRTRALISRLARP